MAGQVYVAVDTAAINDDNRKHGIVVVHKGVTTVREGHWLLKKHPHLFKVLECTHEHAEKAKPRFTPRPPVETARSKPEED
jgi:hypothetical protein